MEQRLTRRFRPTIMRANRPGGNTMKATLRLGLVLLLATPLHAADPLAAKKTEPAVPHVQSEEVKAFRKTAINVSFPSNGLTLHGWLYKPAGDGPFPAVLWNHGSERMPTAHPELGKFYTSHGYVVFLPVRHGHAPSPGEY